MNSIEDIFLIYQYLYYTEIFPNKISHEYLELEIITYSTQNLLLTHIVRYSIGVRTPLTFSIKTVTILALSQDSYRAVQLMSSYSFSLNRAAAGIIVIHRYSEFCISRQNQRRE